MPNLRAISKGLLRFICMSCVQVIHSHQAFLDQALEGLLLGRQGLVKALMHIENMAQAFVDGVHGRWAEVRRAMGSAVASAPGGGADSARARAARREARLAALDKVAQDEAFLSEMVGLYGDFRDKLQELVGRLREHYGAAMKAETRGARLDSAGAGGVGGGSGSTAAATSLSLLEGGDSLEALQNLIERLDISQPMSLPRGAFDY